MAGAKLRGTSGGLIVDLNAATTAEEALAMLDAALTDNATFLNGASLAIDLPTRVAADGNVQAALAVCDARGIEVRAVTSGGRPLYGGGAAPRAAAPTYDAAPSYDAAPDLTMPEIISSECGLVVGTVRSGHTVRHPGVIIVFGDVNAGAEVVAGQSVVVWGALRGTVQAGACGDPTAIVCALSLAPTQLRIDQYIARAPDGPAPQRGAELARVQNGAIVVEAWSSRRTRPEIARGGRVQQAIQDAVHRLRKGVGRWGAS